MEDQNFTPPPIPSQNVNHEEDIPPLKPSNWLWQSIVATILCCLPFGIVGIVYAARVNSLYYNRSYDEAEKAAKNAKNWTIAAFVAGLIYLIIWIMMFSSGNLPSAMENIIENNASGYNF